MATADWLFRGAGLGQTVPCEFVLAVTTPHPRLSELNQATVQPSLECAHVWLAQRSWRVWGLQVSRVAHLIMVCPGLALFKQSKPHTPANPSVWDKMWPLCNQDRQSLGTCISVTMAVKGWGWPIQLLMFPLHLIVHDSPSGSWPYASAPNKIYSIRALTLKIN